MGFLDPLHYVTYDLYKQGKADSLAVELSRKKATGTIQSKTQRSMYSDPLFDPMCIKYRFKILNKKYAGLSPFEQVTSE